MSPFKDTGEMNRRVASGFAGGGVVGGAAAFSAVMATADLAGQTGKMFREDATLAYKFGSFIGAVVLALVYYNIFFGEMKLDAYWFGLMIVMTIFMQSMYSIGKDLVKLRAVDPYLSQGYAWSWFFGFISVVFMVYLVIGSNSDYIDLGRFVLDSTYFFIFMFVAFPKLSYWRIRQNKLNTYAKAVGAKNKAEVKGVVQQMKKELGLRIWKPSALNFISIPLLAAAWYVGQ